MTHKSVSTASYEIVFLMLAYSIRMPYLSHSVDEVKHRCQINLVELKNLPFLLLAVTVSKPRGKGMVGLLLNRNRSR